MSKETAPSTNSGVPDYRRPRKTNEFLWLRAGQTLPLLQSYTTFSYRDPGFRCAPPWAKFSYAFGVQFDRKWAGVPLATVAASVAHKIRILNTEWNSQFFGGQLNHPVRNGSFGLDISWGGNKNPDDLHHVAER